MYELDVDIESLTRVIPVSIVRSVGSLNAFRGSFLANARELVKRSDEV